MHLAYVTRIIYSLAASGLNSVMEALALLRYMSLQGYVAILESLPCLGLCQGPGPGSIQFPEIHVVLRTA
jgi:hypothetical protein